MTTLFNLCCRISRHVSHNPRLRRHSKWRCYDRSQIPFPIDLARRHKPFGQNLHQITRWVTTLFNLYCRISQQVSHSPHLRRHSKWRCYNRSQTPLLIDLAKRHKPFRQNLQDPIRRWRESNRRLGRPRQRPALPSGAISRNRAPATRDQICRSTKPIGTRCFRSSSSGSWIGSCSAARDRGKGSPAVASTLPGRG